MIASESQPGVRYRLDQVAREGGMGVTFFGRRESSEGTSPVVIKVVKPEYGRGLVSAELVARKEALALERLNEQVPPTPFVVRLLDFGAPTLKSGRRMSWIVLEYVHGGVEGTTLEERVDYCLNKTGYGFTPRRAAHLLHCLSSGLSAVHDVKVIHRDLSPNNVLCCGVGQTEIFKIADFGIARAEGTISTFDGIGIGTLGYSAPEAVELSAGPHSDVFSLAGILYYALTGQHYFEAASPRDFLDKVRSASRPKLFDHAPTLHPDLQHASETCSAIDAALATATSFDPTRRPQTAKDFRRLLVECLGSEAPRSDRLASAIVHERRERRESFQWLVRSWPKTDLTVRSAAWDADGRAFALTEDGARFWNGHTWVNASPVLRDLPAGSRFTQRYEAGGWLVGGRGPTLSVLDSTGVSDSVSVPRPSLSLQMASGRFDDLLVAAGSEPNQPLQLWTLVSRRWMRPLRLPGVAEVTTLSRLDDERFLVGGRSTEGGGYAALYAPLQHELQPIALRGVGPLVAGAALPERRTAIVAGGNHVLRATGQDTECARVATGVDIRAAALDVLDRCWAGGTGALWSRAAGGEWGEMWSDAAWTRPFCALLADAGRIAGITVDGGIVEGRSGHSG